MHGRTVTATLSPSFFAKLLVIFPQLDMAHEPESSNQSFSGDEAENFHTYPHIITTLHTFRKVSTGIAILSRRGKCQGNSETGCSSITSIEPRPSLLTTLHQYQWRNKGQCDFPAKKPAFFLHNMKMLGQRSADQRRKYPRVLRMQK